MRAVFLDRDGTINVEKNYIKDPSDIELIPGSSEAISLFNRAGYMVFGISTQSGVARGYFSVDDVIAVNRRVIELAAVGGGEIKEILFCPHHLDGTVIEYSIKCECRKPGTGMIRNATEKYSLKFTDIIVIGDKACDIGVGKNINAKTVLVSTGFGSEEYKILQSTRDMAPDLFAKDLLDAAKKLLG